MHRSPTSLRLAVLAPVLAALLLVLLPGSAHTRDLGPVDPYAPYQPQTRCRPVPKPGTVALARWLAREYGGARVIGLSRGCDVGGTSEHKDGRAIDWGVDVRDAEDRADAADLLTRLLATDRGGNSHALARRMGVMYLIWDDHIYASYDGFSKRAYLSSSCKKRRTCSATLRHRDHVHISLSRAGAKGRTSWYTGRIG